MVRYPRRRAVELIEVGAEQTSVVVATIGRPRLLEQAVASIARCEPAAAEIIVVDQSEERTAERVLERVGASNARVVRDRGKGKGRAVNRGLREARCPIVLMTDDDCTVESGWIAAAVSSLAGEQRLIVCGQVLTVEGADPKHVPSTLALAKVEDITGQIRQDALYGGNMACRKAEVLALGGFDERVRPAAEDCDLCYRWLRAGNSIRHLPDMRIYHHDWRTPPQLVRHYVGYYRGQGVMYARHLRQGNFQVLRFLLQDMVGWARSVAVAALRRRPSWTDARRGALRGLPLGLWDGFRDRSGT